MTAHWAIDTDGFSAEAATDLVVDALFDGRRIWSVAVPATARGETRRVTWPERLRPFLDGQARVTLSEHHSGEHLGEAELTFGSGSGRVEVADPAGRPMVIDKWGFLQRPFDLQDPGVADDLLAQAGDLLDILNETCGVPAWVAFGSLLGAVRDGHVIGHDNDVDLAYLSNYESPVDIAREMFAITRKVQEAGYKVVIKSGSFITVITRQADGAQRDIDIYACFYVEGYLYETASLRARIPREAIVPLTTVTLEGHELAAPADPELMLEASYGPGWRVPDPSFKYRTPHEVTRRFDGWFGNYMKPRRPWEIHYREQNRRSGPAGPSAFATWVAEREAEPTSILDLGCGDGRDALHFAARGHRVRGADLSRAAIRSATKAAADAPGDPEFFTLGLHDLRDTMTRAALLAHEGPPTVLYSRLLVDLLSPDARSNLWRFADTTLRRGGRLYLEFRSGPPYPRDPSLPRNRQVLDPDLALRELGARGARLVTREDGRGMGVEGHDGDPVCRLVVEWPARAEPVDG